MRLTTVALIFFSFGICLPGTAQVISFSGNKVPLKKVFAAIKKQTGYVFFYDESLLGDLKPVTLSARKMDLNDVMEQILKGQGLTYTIENRTIFVRRLPFNEAHPALSEPLALNTIHGRVINPAGEVLAGISITIKNNEGGTRTDKEGNFAISALHSAILAVSGIGYESSEIPAGNTGGKNLTVVLKEKVSSLDEVHIIAYGTTTRRFNVGSIAKISREDIRSQPVNNILAAMQGRVPGLLVTTVSGIPGAAYKVQLRGQNTLGSSPGNLIPDNPFFIIDDVPFTPQNNSYNRVQVIADMANIAGMQSAGMSPFSSINPADIESIEVLKDADATSIYGARGANGVILINTRKIHTGKTLLEGTVNYGVSSIARKMPMMNMQQYIGMRKEAIRNDGFVPNMTINNGYAPDILFLDTLQKGEAFEEYIGSNQSFTNADIFISGGNQINSFSVGSGYHQQELCFPGSFNTKLASANGRFHHNSLNRRLTIDATGNFSYNKILIPGSSSLFESMRYPPTTPDPLNPDGSFRWDYNGRQLSALLGSYQNPLASLNQNVQLETNYLITNLQAGYELAKGLSFKTGIGYNLFSVDENGIFPLSAQSPFVTIKFAASNIGETRSGTFNIEPQLNYILSRGKGQLNILAGGTYQHTTFKSSLESVSTAYNNNNRTADLPVTTIRKTINPYKYVALFGRINYTYAGRYILNITGRTDGSSRFDPDKPYSYFGSAGAGWIFSEESLVKKVLPFLSFGKLKVNYGTTGNDNVGNYLYLSGWSSLGVNNIVAGSQGFVPRTPENPGYSWSTTKKVNAGIELGLFRDRILINAEWYNNRSGDQLVVADIPSQTGFSTVVRNYGAIVQNTGWELGISSTIIDHKLLQLKSSFNISIPHNKLDKFPNLDRSIYSYYYRLGKPLTNVYGYRTAGVNDTTGVYQFYTLNGAKTYASPTVDSRISLGTTDPEYYGGFRNTLTYKGFGLDLFFEFRKQWGPNFLNQFNSIAGGPANTPEIFLEGRWQKPGDHATYQRFTSLYSGQPVASNNASIRSSDIAYGDASFIRLKTAEISYMFQSSLLRKTGITKCRIVLNAQNLFIITNYKGHDPETKQFYAVPPLRTVSTSLQLNF